VEDGHVVGGPMTCTEFQNGAVLRNTEFRAQTAVTLLRQANADFIGAQARPPWGQAQLEIIEEEQRDRPRRSGFWGATYACLWPWSLFVEAAIGAAVGDRVVARRRPMRRSKVERLNHLISPVRSDGGTVIPGVLSSDDCCAAKNA